MTEFPKANVTSEQAAFMMERAYEIGRQHRQREDELVRHNNAQLEENRTQRRIIRQQEGALRRIDAMLRQALTEVDDENRDSLMRAAADLAGNAPDGEDYRYQDQVEAFAGTILETHGFKGVAFHDRLVGLTEAISLFLRDEIGV